jgi:hypothetical protein
MIRRALLALAVSACSTPAPQVLLGFAGPPTQACPSTECSRVPLPCDAVMSIRLVDPSDPGHSFHSQCTKVPADLGYDACSLFGVELDPAMIPVRSVEVQVAVFPASGLPVDDQGRPVCPEDTQYSAAGFPVEQSPAPALGGHAFYHPGDDAVKVTLGCTNISLLHAGPTCGTSASGSTTATVEDFDTRLAVTGGPLGVANNLQVSVGEPHVLDGNFVLTPLDTVPLRLEGGEPPAWSAPAAPKFTRYACVEVLEDVPQTTASVRCVQAKGAVPSLKGTRLSRDTLNTILGLISPPASPPATPEFPEAGITIGVVIDPLLRGASGYTILPQGVRYLGPNGLSGGSATSQTGVFVSTDAPFGTRFSATGPAGTMSAIGGLVAGKVTLVVLSTSSAVNLASPPGVVPSDP